MKLEFRKENEVSKLEFEELVIKRNDDSTYSMNIYGLINSMDKSSRHVFIPKLRDFPLVINRNRGEAIHWRETLFPLTTRWTLSVETALCPDKMGVVLYQHNDGGNEVELS